jgi:glycosyltransferase involved in cell wall biosynthesis
MDVSAEASRLAWPDRPVVEHCEQRILRAASRRIVLSEAIRDDFQARFQLDSVVIPHSIDLAALPVAPPLPARFASGANKKRIVHTGVVEGLQREGLLRIARAIHAHPEWNASLILSTPTSHADLRASGFDLPCVEIGTFSNAEVCALQRAADLLVAALPFEGVIDVYQRTAFPTKVVEYMTAGVPILAHAPADSFFARHIREHGYAFLADDPDEAALGRALAGLLEDAVLREQLVRRARVTVESVFDLREVAPRFAGACGLDPAVLK